MPNIKITIEHDGETETFECDYFYMFLGTSQDRGINVEQISSADNPIVMALVVAEAVANYVKQSIKRAITWDR